MRFRRTPRDQTRDQTPEAEPARAQPADPPVKQAAEQTAAVEQTEQVKASSAKRPRRAATAQKPTTDKKAESSKKPAASKQASEPGAEETLTPSRLRRSTRRPAEPVAEPETVAAAAEVEDDLKEPVLETPADTVAEPGEGEPTAPSRRRGRVFLRLLVILPAVLIVGLTAATVVLRSNGPLPPDLIASSGPQPFLVHAWQVAQASQSKHGFPPPKTLARRLSAELGVHVVAGTCAVANKPQNDLVVDTVESAPDTLVLYTKGGQGLAGLAGLVAGYDQPQPSLFSSHSCTLSPLASYASTVLFDNAQAYWLLDRVDKRLVTHDLSDAQRPLSYHGTALKHVPALGGYATFFNGASAYLDGGRAFDFPRLQPFSIELWANPDQQGQDYHCLVSRQSLGARPDGYTIWLRAGQGLGFNRYGRGQLDTVIDPHGLPSGRWSDVVASYDGQTISLYVDGRRAAHASAPAVSLPTDARFRVGSASSAGCYYSGGLARLSVYGYALTPTMVARHYALAQVPAPAAAVTKTP